MAKRESDTVEVTREMLTQGRGADGDYTKAQLAILGVSWPPPRGWKSGVVGSRISAEDADAFLELRDNQGDLFGR